MYPKLIIVAIRKGNGDAFRRSALRFTGEALFSAVRFASQAMISMLCPNARSSERWKSATEKTQKQRQAF
jgi:hypothetical protein